MTTTNNYDEPERQTTISNEHHRQSQIDNTATQLSFTPDPLQAGLWAIRHAESNPSRIAEDDQ